MNRQDAQERQDLLWQFRLLSLYPSGVL